MNGDINVDYDVEGICIGYFKIDFKTNRWLISEVGYACD